MGVWRRFLVLGTLPLLVAATAAAPASAATSGIDVKFVAVGVTGSFSGGLCGGPSSEDWTLSGVALGSSPAAGTLSLNYGHSVGTGVEFTLKDLEGNSVTAGGFSESPTSVTGTITSGSGADMSLSGHPFTLTFDVTPEATQILYGQVVPISSGSCVTTTLDPTVAVGSLVVS